MVNQQLVQYVQDNLKKGYNYQQIKQFLVSNNWPVNEVDEAIGYVYSSNVHQMPIKHHFSVSKNILIASVFVLVVVVGLFGLFALLSTSSAPAVAKPTQVEYKVSVLDSKIEKGGTLEVVNKLSGLEGLSGYELYPTYRIINQKTNNPLAKWSPSTGISSSTDSIISRSLSNIPTGSYYLEATTAYKGQKLTAQVSFVVYEESVDPTCSDGIKNQGEEQIDCGGPCDSCMSCTDGIKNQGEKNVDCGGPCAPCGELCESECNDFNVCTEDLCVDGECRSEMIFPCCGNFICEDSESPVSCPVDCDEELGKDVRFMTRSEIIDEAKRILQKSQKEASNFCESVPTVKYRDDCFRIIAHDSGNILLCVYIDETVKKDSCYVDFAMEFYDYSGCTKVENVYLRKSCEALKKRPNPYES